MDPYERQRFFLAEARRRTGKRSDAEEGEQPFLSFPDDQSPPELRRLVGQEILSLILVR